MEETKLWIIENTPDLKRMIHKLSSESEIAVDLEHHSYRSFKGFTCLMQISTHEEDFLIDTLKLRHRMHLLLPIFSNLSILKVMHGAQYDIEWL